MQPTVTLEVRQFGRKAPLVSPWSIPLSALLPEPAAPATLGDLIAAVVRAEVAAFQQRQEQRRLVHVLTAAQIERGVEEGRVDSGGRDLRQEVDPQAAVRTALQAFEDGLYLVFVDGAQPAGLDAALSLGPGSRVEFVRLVALSGG